MRNKLVGFIEQPIEGDKANHVSIFVSRNDISLETVVGSKPANPDEDGPTI